MNEMTATDIWPVVGIGASAGGLEALGTFVSRIPAQSGITYVIVQHLAPDRRTIIDELLQAKSSLPVTQAEDGERLSPGAVLVVPAGHEARLEGDHIRLVASDRTDAGRPLRPIDGFLGSLAEARGRSAFAVILSGTGSDGSDGVRAVKAAGGFAIVQASDGARFPGMPDSALATGLVDFVLPADAIPNRIAEIVAQQTRMTDGAIQADLDNDIADHLPAITARLSEVSGNDFSDYKPATLLRRIERRMTLLRVQSSDRLLEILRDDEEQAHLLAQEFLIGVTRFMRDEDAFAALRERVVAPAVARDQNNLRVWVPGCSTGEEAYSIAILFLEEMARQDRRHALQVFGTDIDKSALIHARAGLYPAAAMEPLSPDLRARHFTVENGQFRALPALRDVCVFAPHNVVQDPPFSRLDLISCRNLMIYLSAGLQSQLLPRFHFALRPGGHLFLGPSEGVGDAGDRSGDGRLFKARDKTHRIFARNDDTPTRYSALTDPVPRPRGALPPGIPAPEVISDGARAGLTTEALAERSFLRQHAAPFALLSKEGEVVYLSEPMSDFVRPTPGAPSAMLDGYLARELRVPVRTALAEAADKGREVRVCDVVLGEGDDGRLVDVRIAPTEQGKGLFLLTIDPVRTVEAASLGDALRRREDADRDLLEAENFALRRQIAASQQEYETSGQELRSSNEELLSMNEELQSANEELETSREELQSINEELETVNAELQENNRQLVRAHSDLKNLFESTDIAVLFLDRNLCVRSFTPATTALFGIRPRDTGRPIGDLSTRVDYDRLAEDAAEVDETLQPIEREVRTRAADQTFILRIKPYRTTDNVIDGYMLSFVDITARKRQEDRLRQSEEALAKQYAELENLYDTTPVGLALLDREFRYLRINEELAVINGLPVEEHIGKTGPEVVPDVTDTVTPIMNRVFETGEPALGMEVTGWTRATNEPHHYIVDYYPVRNEGEVFAVGACVRDVTEQVNLRRDLAASLATAQEAEARLTRLFDAAPVLISLHEGPDHVFTYANPAASRAVGDRPLLGLPLVAAVPEIADHEVPKRFDRVFRTGEAASVPNIRDIIFGPGDPKHSDVYNEFLQPWFDADGAVAGVMSFTFDVTELQKALEQKTLLLGELQHRVKNTMATIGASARMLAIGDDAAMNYVDRFLGRLGAMARTHDLLVETDWSDVRLSEILRSELAPYIPATSDVWSLTGPDLELDAARATTMGMAVHELVTNAVKYGALSAPVGRIRIRTERRERTDGFTKVLTWNEEDGPPIASMPSRRGFGSVVLREVVAGDLDGEVEMTFRPEGLSVRIAFD